MLLGESGRFLAREDSEKREERTSVCPDLQLDNSYRNKPIYKIAAFVSAVSKLPVYMNSLKNTSTS